MQLCYHRGRWGINLNILHIAEIFGENRRSMWLSHIHVYIFHWLFGIFTSHFWVLLYLIVLRRELSRSWGSFIDFATFATWLKGNIRMLFSDILSAKRRDHWYTLMLWLFLPIEHEFYRLCNQQICQSMISEQLKLPEQSGISTFTKFVGSLKKDMAHV